MAPQNYKFPNNCFHRTEAQASFQIIQFNGRNISKYSSSSDVDGGVHGIMAMQVPAGQAQIPGLLPTKNKLM